MKSHTLFALLFLLLLTACPDKTSVSEPPPPPPGPTGPQTPSVSLSPALAQLEGLGSELFVTYISNRHNTCFDSPRPLCVRREDDSTLLQAETGETEEELARRFFEEYGNAAFGLDPDSDILQRNILRPRRHARYKQYYGDFYVAQSNVQISFGGSGYRWGIESVCARVAPQASPNTTDESETIPEEEAISVLQEDHSQLSDPAATDLGAELVLFDGRTIHLTGSQDPPCSTRLAWMVNGKYLGCEQVFGYVDALDGAVLFKQFSPCHGDP